MSRFKFWGTPLPIWRCEGCGEDRVIGSIEELEKNSIKKIHVGKDFNLHKPEIDTVKFKCVCGKEMSRIPDVIDCWYDSGSASFAQFHYPFENKKQFERSFPYDFIAEAIDQTRGWFYTLHVLATILFKKPAYKNVICAGHILDEKGEKMSKSKGNIIKPRDILDKTGVDAVRLQFCATDVGNAKRFSENLMRESVIPFLIVLYNCNTYYQQIESKKLKKRIEDDWIISRLNSLTKEVTEDLEKFSISPAFVKIVSFVINDFSRNYIKMTRDRDDTKEIIGKILEKVSLLLSPFAPYITEHIYKNFSKESVHLASWPKGETKKINKKLEEEFENVLLVIEKGLAERDKLQIGLKWPLKSANITADFDMKKDLFDVIASQLNVKEVYFEKVKQEDPLSIKLDTKTTPELEAEGYARELSRLIQSFRKQLGLKKENSIDTYIITDDKFKKILEGQRNFIKERTNSKKIDFVTTDKERFKNIIHFTIKDRKGDIAVVS